MESVCTNLVHYSQVKTIKDIRQKVGQAELFRLEKLLEPILLESNVSDQCFVVVCELPQISNVPFGNKAAFQ
jgi:hypothetical protein